MPQLTNKKFIIYIFLLTLLGTFNNKNLKEIDLFKISKINISGLEGKEKKELSKQLDLFLFENLFFLNRASVEEILKSNNLVEDYQIFKKYPMSLEIEIVETKFLAQTNINGKFFFIGSNGKLIENKNNDKSLPYIFGELDINSFLNLKKIIDESSLDFQEIKNFYFFPSGRWDIETYSGILLKLPKLDFEKSLNLYNDLLKKNKLNDVNSIDFRQIDQVIING